MKLFVIVDNGSIARWQARALETLPDVDSLEVLNCRNTRVKRRLFRHAFYYALNSLTVRNYWTRRVSVEEMKIPVIKTTEFDSEYDGAWQRLPPHVIALMNASGADAIIKFGMSLLRVPPSINAPILSYHHGDPARYRGRPAGFWETLHGCRTIGQVVQIICDRLDAGSIVACAETNVFSHSYRATLMNAYRHSPLLLRTAISNALDGRTLERDRSGRNYRLPSNWTVLRLVLRMTGAFLKRLAYGAFFEKRWSVSTAPGSVEAIVDEGQFPHRATWQQTNRSARHIFHADPFFSDDPPGILVEAVNRGTGKGELVLLVSGEAERILTQPRHHYSYPASVCENGKTYIVPEIAQWSSPQILELTQSGLVPVQALHLQEDERIVDPTIFQAGDGVYLFGNKKSVGASALCLWWSESLFGRFVEHDASPVLVSPAGGRMGGKVVNHRGRLYRMGQDCSGAYGNGMHLFRIERIDRYNYSEVFEQEIRFADVKGPHTINFGDGLVLFDWYRDAFHPLSWLTRLRSRRREV